MYKQFSNAQAIYEGGCVVSTLAGTGEAGCRDGAKDQAQFQFPMDVAVDKDGDIYVADVFNSRLRKIAMADGIVQTVAGARVAGYKGGPAREAQFQFPDSIAVGHDGDVFITNGLNRIHAFSPTLTTVQPIAVHEGGISSLCSVAIAADGSILLCDNGNHLVVKIRAERGSVETVAGNGQCGYLDGEARQAQFNKPSGIAVSPNGDIYVADGGNNCLRKIDAQAGVVSTVAGTGADGWRDGDASEALFNNPRGLGIGADGCVYISDAGNGCIRKFDPAHRRVTTVAGTGNKVVCDGVCDEAQFHHPQGLTFGRDGVLYVADGENHCIRAITFPEPEFSESDFQDIEKKLERKTQLMNELAQEIHEAMASTLAARENLEKTKDATTEATKELAETQKALKVKRLELRAVWEQRKAELETVESELAKMESTKVERVEELASVKTELDKAQTVLEKAIAEKMLYAEELARVEIHLEKTRAKNAMERSTGVVVGMAAYGLKEEKSKDLSGKKKPKTDQGDDSREVAGNIPEMASGVAASVKKRAPTEGPQDETAVSTARTARCGRKRKGKGFRRPAATYEEVSEAASACDREKQRVVPGGARQDECRGRGGTARAGKSDKGEDAVQETSRLHGA